MNINFTNENNPSVESVEFAEKSEQYTKKRVKNLKNSLFWCIFARFFNTGCVKGFASCCKIYFACDFLLTALFVLKKNLLNKNEKKSILAVYTILYNGNSGSLCPIFLCQR